MGIIEALKNGFVMTAKMKLMLLIVIVVNFLVFVLGFGTVGSMINPADLAAGQLPENIGSIWGLLALVVLINFLISTFLLGGILGLGDDQIKKGQASISNFLSYGAKYFLRILGLSIINAVIIFLILLLLGLVLTIIGLAKVQVLSVIAAVIAIILFLAILFVMAYTLLAIPVVTEDLGIIEAFKKGINVSSNNYFKTVALVLILVALAVGLQQLFLYMLNLSANVAVGMILGIISFIIQTFIWVSAIYALLNMYQSVRVK